MKNKSAQKPWWEDPTTLVTAVIAAATVINVAAAIWIGNKTSEYTEITKNIYKASSRPYVGIESIDVNKNDDKHILIHVNYKNFGTVPARDVRVDYGLLFDGYQAHKSNEDIYDSHSNLFPQVTHGIRIKTGSNYENVISGKTVLDIVVKIKYQGTGKDLFEDYERWRYYPIHDHFHHVCASAK